MPVIFHDFPICVQHGNHPISILCHKPNIEQKRAERHVALGHLIYEIPIHENISHKRSTFLYYVRKALAAPPPPTAPMDKIFFQLVELPGKPAPHVIQADVLPIGSNERLLAQVVGFMPYLFIFFVIFLRTLPDQDTAKSGYTCQPQQKQHNPYILYAYKHRIKNQAAQVNHKSM